MMTEPVVVQKDDVKDFTFNELVDWCAWHMVERLLQGGKLRSIIYEIVNAATYWHKENNK